MKTADLSFYAGISIYPAEIIESEYSQMIGDPEQKIAYPYQGINAQYYNINTSGGDQIFYGDKILNNNVIFNGDAYLCPFIGATYQIINDTDLEFTLTLPVTNISGSNDFSQVTYPTVTFEDFLPAQTGTVDGINALRFRQLYATQEWYGAYPCTILKSTISTPQTPTQVVTLTNNELQIIDFDVANPATPLTNIFAYFITDQSLYWVDTSGNETAITLPSNFISLTAVCSYQENNATYQDRVWVAGFDSVAGQQKLVLLDSVTGEILKYDTVGAGGDFKINRLQFVGTLSFTGDVAVTVCTQKGFYQLNANSESYSNVRSADTTRDVTDLQLWEINFKNGSGEWHVIWSTTAGFYIHRTEFNGGSSQTEGYETSTSFKCIGAGYPNYTTNGDTQFGCFIGGSGIAYTAEGNWGATNIGFSNISTVKDSDKDYLDALGFYNTWNFDDGNRIRPTNEGKGVIAPSGFGIQEINLNGYQNGDNIVTGTIYFKYTLDFNDIVKENTSIYYGLLSIVGCGQFDSAAALFKIDTEKQIGTVGTLTGTVTTNRLWIADNYFILNNTEDKNSLYYKSLLNLDLSELTGNQQELVGEDAGIFNTTEAGNVIDIIIDKSMFYLVGTRAIEVWQNGGATGFPYRKQPNQTAEFHNFPKALSSINVNISRYCAFREGYIIATIDATKNELDILYMQNGAAKPMPYNKNGWLQVVNTYIATNQIQDISVTTLKFYGQEYLSFLLLDGGNLAVGSIVVNMTGGVFFIAPPTSDLIRYDRTVTQTGVLTTITSTDIISNFEPYIHSSIAVGDFDYVMTSEFIRPFSTEIFINKIVIQYVFPIENIDNVPANAEYKIEMSADGKGDVGFTYTGLYDKDLRQIVIPINAVLPSLVVKFSSNIPIIIIKSLVEYDDVGVK